MPAPLASLKSLSPRSPLLLLAFGLVLMFAAYWGGLTELVTRWNKQEEYGHGFFIPLIAIWLLWKREDALRGSMGQGSWLGAALIGVGAVLLVIGELTALFILIQFGFLVSLAGIVMSYAGPSLLKVSILPIALLVFAIPLPYFVDAQLSWRLQLLSSQIGVGILRLLGTSVFLEGNVIDLGIFKLQVVEACSGLRYLYPLLSLGFLMSYMYRGAMWQRVLLFLSTIPVTIFMNSLRIAMVGLLVNQWGDEMADGFLHYFEGWVIFMVCLALLLGEVWCFERFGQRRDMYTVIDVPLIRPVAPGKQQRGLNVPLLASVLILLAASVMVNVMNHREEIKPARFPLATFPLSLNTWQAKESSMSKQIETFLGLDDYVLADYLMPGESAVNFYVAYYASQRKGVSPHSPEVCMPGGGWVITSLQPSTIKLIGIPAFEVNRTVIERDGDKQIVYYWFEQRGRRITNQYLMKWYLLVDALTRNRTDGALVRVVTPVGQRESAEAADARLIRFLQESVPKLHNYVPE